MALDQSLGFGRILPAALRGPLDAVTRGLANLTQRPVIDITAPTYAMAFAAVILAGAALQFAIYHAGLYSISADESARAIFAHNLTFDNAFELTFWTPLNKIMNGLALKIHDDLYVTPRILTGLLGLATIGAVMMLANRLFENRLVAVIAGVLALALPQRLILSVAPLSDMQAFFLTLFGTAFLVTWFRKGSVSDLLIACTMLLLASMVRFESWFLNALLGLYLAYRALIKRDLAFVPFVIAGALISVFPLYWLAKIYILDGSLARLGMTTMQFTDTYGRSYVQAFKSDALVLYIKDMLTSPAVLFGTLGVTLVALKDAKVRPVILLVFAPLFILGVMMVATLSVPLAAPFRIDGMWVLLAMPFAAWLIVTAADHLRTSTMVRVFAVLVLAYIGFMASLIETHDTVKGYYANANDLIVKEDLVMGDKLRDILAHDPRNIMVDAIDNLSFLNAAAVANAPERMIANVDADLVITGIYSTSRPKYEADPDKTILDTYMTDKFNILGGLDPAQLQARNIGYLLMRNANYIAACDQNPLLEKLGTYGAWVLYEVKQS